MFAARIMEEKELFEKVTHLFMQLGIKSMTMDEIARQLGISKKTLYQFVDNKKDLVKKSIEYHIGCEECNMTEILGSCENAIDEIMEMTTQVSTEMKNMHPSVMFDMKKYHPEAFKVLLKHKDEFVRKSILKNLESGVAEGYYRTNLNPQVVTEFYLSMVSTIINTDNSLMKKHKFSEILSEMMRYHIRGIASSKGREYLKQKFSQHNV